MPTATIDRLEVNYLTRGSGPALLMLAPGGFDATMEAPERVRERILEFGRAHK
jgi:hypothetical protein